MRDRATLDKESFLKHYGHLRPGTYDILSLRYDESPDLYFDWNEPSATPRALEPFTLNKSQEAEISDLLRSHKLEIEVEELFNFIKSGIELRELAK